MADAFLKGFGDGFLFIPQLIGSSIGLTPPPSLLTQTGTDPKVFESFNNASSNGSSVVSDVTSSEPRTIGGVDQTTALLVGGGVLLLLLLI
jgi:hypothetical protein